MTAESDVTELAERVRAGEVRAIARAARLIDDRDPRRPALLQALYPHTGKARVLGITGTPGSGKSTLVDRLIEAYRARDLTVAVVAVDPTSPYSGGAILGDRIRMQRHFLDPGVFIRSVATRGSLGGLSRSAADIVRVLDAAGYDVVLVETVGVGQDELDIARHAHTTVVVMAPGMGDDIQAIKAGILEVADVFAVNKADRDGAGATATDLEQMIALGNAVRPLPKGHGHAAAALRARKEDTPDDSWSPPVIKTSALKGTGIDELVEACDKHRAFLTATPAGQQRQGAQRREELVALFRAALVEQAERRLGPALGEALDAVEDARSDPYTLAERLVAEVLRKADPPRE